MKKEQIDTHKLWRKFREITDLQSRQKSEELNQSDGLTTEDFYFDLAEEWLCGEHFSDKHNFDDAYLEYLNTPGSTPELHHAYCDIFKAPTIVTKRQAMVARVKEDPRWLYDKCSISLFFEAVDHDDFVFIKEIGEALVSNPLQPSKTGLEHLKNYVFECFSPSKYCDFCDITTHTQKDKNEYLRKNLKTIYEKIESLIKEFPELKEIKQINPTETYKTFLTTVGKWYKMELNYHLQRKKAWEDSKL